jgi:flavin-dependent dehydrogenase
MNPVQIVGGGLAGLALGRALARARVPVTVMEAQDYPRHRVCGEFICGLREGVRRDLDLSPMLEGAVVHRNMTWHWRGRHVRRDTLPRPAFGLSRHALDQRLAEAFVAAGGELHVRTRVDPDEIRPGRIWATGRRLSRSAGDWIGLKAHAGGLQLAADLEFHLADGAYVGLTTVERGEVNVCGLFRRRADVKAAAAVILPAYLRACGLHDLADRVEPALQQGSHAAVAALSFDRHAPNDRVALGDAFAMIPPFTGDGMAMAFESASLAVGPVEAYARGQQTWAETETLIRNGMRARFRWRLTVAGALQRFLVNSRGQACFAALADRGLLPFRHLFRILH